MKKISAFYSFLVFVLISASMAVVPAHAQASGTQYFCIDTQTSGVLKLFQKNGGDVNCYLTWNDVYDEIDTWMQNQTGDAVIQITSDIAFAGKSADGTSCKTGNTAFGGMMLDLKDKFSLVGTSASPHYKISGLCHIADADEVGFVKGAKKVENLDFEKVLFKSTKTSSKVGIVALNSQSAVHVYQNIHVKNSSFYGHDVGAVLGNGAAYISNISLTEDTITSGNYGGGVAGYLVTNLRENDDGSTNNVYSGFDVQFLRIRSVNGKSGGDTYFGGVAGFVMQYEKVVWAKSSLAGLDIQNGSYVGGLLGMANHSDAVSVAEESKYSEIDVGSKSNSIIFASKYAGGLVGYIIEDCAYTALSVTKNSVRASIRGGGASSDSYVGGLIGFIHFTSTEKLGLTINYNKVTDDVYGGATDKVGYLVGSMDCKNVNFKSVQYNFYYGDNEDGNYNPILASNEAIIGIGSFNVEGNWLKGTIKSKRVNVSYNFRNAVSGLSADGVLDIKDDQGNILEDPIKVSDTKRYCNGVIDASIMKTQDFVDALNSGSTGANNWEYDDVDNLPSVITGNGVGSNKYNVTFDFTPLSNNPYIVFGNAWATNNWSTTKKIKASETKDAESRFPKAYVLGQSDKTKFFKLLWKYDEEDAANYEYLFSSLYPYPDNHDITVYAALDEKSANGVNRLAVDIVALDEDGNNLFGESDYHGSIVLSQKVNGVTYQQESQLVKMTAQDYCHRFFVPKGQSDTLIFNVTLNPDAGYEMTDVNFTHSWLNAPANENWGYSKALGTFKFNADRMSLLKFTVRYNALSYNVRYTIPESMQDKGLFVVSDNNLIGGQTGVTIENINEKAPKIYDSDLCSVGWIVADENLKPRKGQMSDKLVDELQYMQPSGSSNVENVLIPNLKDLNCPLNKGSYNITLNVDGQGEIVLLQELVDGENKIVVEHPFKEEEGVLELKIPKVKENSSNGSTPVPLVIKAVPKAGYVFKGVTYKIGGVTAASLNGSLNDGDQFSVISDMELTAKFEPMSPVDLVFNENAGNSESFFGDSWANLLSTGNFDDDNAGNWFVEQSYSINDKDSKFPLDIYRDGYCLQGYTLAKNDKKDGVFTKFDDEFINVSKAAALTTSEESSSIPVYAYWEECSNQDFYTVYAADGDKGTLTLSRTFAPGGLKKTYKVGANGLRIPKVETNDAVSNANLFTEISFEVKQGAGVLLDTDKPYTYKDHGAEVGWVDFSSSLKVTSDLDIKAPLIMDLFNSTYALDVNMANENTADVFFGDDFKFLWTAVAFGDKLPTNIYRADAKLVGWSFEQDATADKAITVFDKKFVETFESYDNANQFGVNFDPTKKEYPVLFAVWETSVVPTYTVKSNEKDKGTLSLSQTVGGKTFTHVVDGTLLVPAVGDGLEFTVNFEAVEDWVLADGKSLVWNSSDGTSKSIENGAIKHVNKDYVVTVLGNAKNSDGPEVVGTVVRVAVDAKYGKIEFIEEKDGNKIVHTLDENGQIVLPSDIDSDKWTLHVVPNEGYVLESLVLTKDGKEVAVLHNGDKLPKDMENVVMTAKFEKEGENPNNNPDDNPGKNTDKDPNKPTPSVDERYQKSGNTVKIDFSSNDIDKTNETTASLKIVDLQTGKDSVIRESIKISELDQITIRIAKPGEYKVVLTLLEGENPIEKTQIVTIESPFETVAAESWQMLSLAAVDASVLERDDVFFYWWNEGGIGEFWQYQAVREGETLDPSRGVWYTSRSEEPLKLRSDYKDEGQDIVWDLECKNSGWNLVANPHGWYVDLYSNNKDKKAKEDEESEVYFRRYNSETGAYDPVDTLKPYEAVWAKVSKKTKWVVSAEPVFVNDLIETRHEGEILTKSTVKDNWTLRVVLSDGNGKRDSWNLLGASDHPFDAEEPPASMGDHVNLSILDGKRALEKSLKAPSDDMEWTISLKASSIREGYLTLGGIDNVKSHGYRVYVTVDGDMTEMQEGKALPVLLKSSSKTATVRVTKGAPVVAKNAAVKGLRSARLGNKLHVSFDASESLAGTNARVELLDVKGNVKSTASTKTLFGTNALVLDAPRAGFYLLRVRAGSVQQVRKVLVK